MIEKFVQFVGGQSHTGDTQATNLMANTVPVQKVGPQPAQSSMQPGHSSSHPGQSQPSPATAQKNLHLSNWCNTVGQDNPLAGFVVVRRENHDDNDMAAAILNTSSCFSRIPINYHYQKVDHCPPSPWSSLGRFECTVSINGVDVVKTKAIGRKKAREQAVVEALAVLPKHCFTLKVKKDIRAESVTLDQVANDLAARNSFSDNHMATNSVANKMMKQMGWTGGGLGKDGEGITEPIRPSEVFGRQGLGHIETNKGAVTPAFRKRVRDIIQNYACNSSEAALAFSSEFSKDQRVEIHNCHTTTVYLPLHHHTITLQLPHPHLTTTPSPHHRHTFTSPPPHPHLTTTTPSPHHHHTLTSPPPHPHLTTTTPSPHHHHHHHHLTLTLTSPHHHHTLTSPPPHPHLHTTLPSRICRLSHLKSVSRGKDGASRCLVITRKVAAQDLLLRLLQEGSNDQYTLIPPNNPW
ncbi:NF-kappa-B-repressing factor [Chionoecetes opilio]|uniref:NF-kappa-B-repressing factor n=1 Tax=Chionoecetes opilio TaxID=41210 RepID=A0A8J5CJG3_CHIOP|nr:NF-kappa-B-repressing factor [Chionoecetes opilio]